MARGLVRLLVHWKELRRAGNDVPFADDICPAGACLLRQPAKG
jgi:hypothetical protein